MGSRKPVKSMIFQKYNYFAALQMFFRLVCPIQRTCKGLTDKYSNKLEIRHYRNRKKYSTIHKVCKPVNIEI